MRWVLLKSPKFDGLKKVLRLGADTNMLACINYKSATCYGFIVH